jgi:hypothetical protein
MQTAVADLSIYMQAQKSESTYPMLHLTVSAE